MDAQNASATSEQKFREHFDDVVRAKLEELNAYRKRTLRSILLWWFTLVPGLILVGFGAAHLPRWLGEIVLWLCIPGLMLALVLPYSKFYDPYRKSFKEQLVAPLVSAYRAGLVYSPKGRIDRDEFNDAGLFRERTLTNLSGEDRIDGLIGETKFRFSEVDAENVTSSRGSDGKTKSRTRSIFRGLFYVAEFNKDFNGATYVFPDHAQRLLGSLGQSLQANETLYGQLVKLEDPEFERHFVVYSTGQIEARYILSSALMQRIVGLRVRTGKKLRIGFASSHLFIAIASGKNHFEPRLFRTVNARLFREFWDVLDTFVAIVEELNLNTRIWTKTAPK